MAERQNTKQAELWTRIQEIIGDLETPGTLRYQAADLSEGFGEFGVVIAIDKAKNCEWMPNTLRYKFALYFTHWAVMAITRLSDNHSNSISIPALRKLSQNLRDQGGMKRDPWIERIVEISHWRERRDIERQERFERLIMSQGKPQWSEVGLGEKADRLNYTWNRVTGREHGSDGCRDDMEDWIFDSAIRPLNCPQVKAVRKWRNKSVAHQDINQLCSGSTVYDVFPILTIIRAYWAVMVTLHRVLLLTTGTGLYGLYPKTQFSVTKILSGETLDCTKVEFIDDQLTRHSVKWDCLLHITEQRWYKELIEIRRNLNGVD